MRFVALLMATALLAPCVDAAAAAKKTKKRTTSASRRSNQAMTWK